MIGTSITSHIDWSITANYTYGEIQKNNYKWIQIGPMHEHNMKRNSMNDTYF